MLGILRDYTHKSKCSWLLAAQPAGIQKARWRKDSKKPVASWSLEGSSTRVDIGLEGLYSILYCSYSFSGLFSVVLPNGEIFHWSSNFLVKNTFCCFCEVCLFIILHFTLLIYKNSMTKNKRFAYLHALYIAYKSRLHEPRF